MYCTIINENFTPFFYWKLLPDRAMFNIHEDEQPHINYLFVQQQTDIETTSTISLSVIFQPSQFRIFTNTVQIATDVPHSTLLNAQFTWCNSEFKIIITWPVYSTLQQS